ncbi:MAG: phosphoribosylglycinamide synthetase [Pseudomonadota bacterium]
MSSSLQPLTIPADAKSQLTVLFLAKNALWDGETDPEDGNHAVYHREMRQMLERIGVNVMAAQTHDMLFDPPEGIDFVFPLLNRAGFFNSEMLVPLLCERAGLPYLGASPILRGLSDDKHLAKLAAVNAGIPTAPWAVYRKHAPITPERLPEAERYVIKPNNSSASWGVQDAYDWEGVAAAVERIHTDPSNGGQDAIVEPFIIGNDVGVPVITMHGEPQPLKMLVSRQKDPLHLRSYAEKRDLVDPDDQSYTLEEFDNPELEARILELTHTCSQEYRPFDYGRYEFRVNEDTGAISFVELNLNCNLWSQKSFGRAAAIEGWTQEQLIETLLAEAMTRYGIL